MLSPAGRSLIVAAILVVASAIVPRAAAQFADGPQPGDEASGPFRAGNGPLDLLDAVARGKVEATLSLDNSRGGKLWLRNTGETEVTVRLPEAFAAVPKPPRGYADPPQTMGGGFPPADESTGDDDRRRFGEPPAGRVVTLPPNGSHEMPAATVCLDPQRPPPSPGVEYEICPITEVTNNPAVVELCRMLSERHTNQRAAQAAAWHLHNGIAWQLMAVWRSPRPGATFQPQFFTGTQLRLGRKLAERAVREARERMEEGRGRGRQ